MVSQQLWKAGQQVWKLSELFCHAYEQAATVQKAVNRFRSSGIVPFHPDIFGDEDFAPSTVTELQMPQTNNELEALLAFSDDEVSVTVAV